MTHKCKKCGVPISEEHKLCVRCRIKKKNMFPYMSRDWKGN